MDRSVRGLLMVLALAAASAAAVDAQSRPAGPAVSRPAPHRFHFRGADNASVDLRVGPPIATAVDGTSSLVVDADGRAEFRVHGNSDNLSYGWRIDGEPDRGDWILAAVLPPEQLAAVVAAAANARSRGRPLDFETLATAARLPRWFTAGAQDWLVRHQERDGHWSAAGFGWNCYEPYTPTCANFGDPTSDEAVTALGSLTLTGAGYGGRQDPERPEPERDPVHQASNRALAFLSGYTVGVAAAAADTSSQAELGDALLALALSRLATSATDSRSAPATSGCAPAMQRTVRRVRNAAPLADDRALVARMWSLLALKEAGRPGLQLDITTLGHALASIEAYADAVLARPPAGNEVQQLRALAIVTAARIAAGKPGFDRGSATETLRAKLELLRPASPGSVDEDVVLFGILAADACGDVLWKQWRPVVNTLGIATQLTLKDGCAQGSWLTGGAWSAAGGRVYCTGVMSLALETYLRYPRHLTLTF